MCIILNLYKVVYFSSALETSFHCKQGVNSILAVGKILLWYGKTLKLKLQRLVSNTALEGRSTLVHLTSTVAGSATSGSLNSLRACSYGQSSGTVYFWEKKVEGAFIMNLRSQRYSCLTFVM